MDRLLAAMGLLDDAVPLFARTDHLPSAGVLLAVPALVASGVLSAAQQIYGSLAPAFYGLRTTVVAYMLLALLRIARLRESYGTEALDYLDGRTPTMNAFTKAEQQLQHQMEKVRARIVRLVKRQKTLPARVPLRDTPHGAEAVQLSTERKHLTNVLKMVAYQIESTLVEQLQPYYARTDDEGRTLMQTALRGGGAIEPTADELRVTLARLSSPHRSAALRRLCEDLNKTATPFPGMTLRLCFSVAHSAS